MKDLMKLVAEVIADFDAMKIRYRTVRSWTVNPRLRTTWGALPFQRRRDF